MDACADSPEEQSDVGLLGIASSSCKPPRFSKYCVSIEIAENMIIPTRIACGRKAGPRRSNPGFLIPRDSTRSPSARPMNARSGKIFCSIARKFIFLFVYANAKFFDIPGALVIEFTCQLFEIIATKVAHIHTQYFFKFRLRFRVGQNCLKNVDPIIFGLLRGAAADPKIAIVAHRPRGIEALLFERGYIREHHMPFTPAIVAQHFELSGIHKTSYAASIGVDQIHVTSQNCLFEPSTATTNVAGASLLPSR